MAQINQKPYLDQVIQCLVQRQKSNLRFRKPQRQNITNLYESTKALLAEFQDHINTCKKYNEAKIHRKYQILLKDLSDQNDILKSKVSEQLHSRPSSQKYVSDLIDKMIYLRRQNERLMRENQSLNNIINTSGDKNKLIINSSPYDYNPQNKELLKKQHEKNIIKNALTAFIVNKKALNKNLKNRQKSNFQKFLIFNKGKTQKWEMIDFVQKIDKWTANLKDVRFIDRSKIKSSFQRSFENQRKESPSAAQRLPNTINTLRTTKQTKSFLENGHSPKSKLVEPIISKNKRTTTFRLRTLTNDQQENRMEEEYIQ